MKEILSSNEFFDWIKQQPDDRMLNMSEYLNEKECGCLLVQYGRHKNLCFDSVGFHSIGLCDFKTSEEKRKVSNFIQKLLSYEETTFKKAKELLSYDEIINQSKPS